MTNYSSYIKSIQQEATHFAPSPVAIVNDNAVASWTAQSIPAPSMEFCSIAWSPQLKMAVATSNNSAAVLTSTDGVNWTTRSCPSADWEGICWASSLEKFVAVAGNSPSFMYSSDGIHWSTGNVSGPGGQGWIGVAWAPSIGTLVAVANGPYGSTNRVATSTDGINWTVRSAFVQDWQGVCWSPELGLFCAVAFQNNGNYANNAMTSPDGINWTLQNTPQIPWRGVCWSSELGKFVAVSHQSPYVMTSPDGVNWTEQNGTVGSCQSAWSPQLGYFVATNTTGSGPAVMTSPDGITWTSQSSLTNLGFYRAICWAPELGMFLCPTNQSGTNYVVTSDSLITPNNLNNMTVKNIASNLTLSSGTFYLVDTTAARTLTLPTPNSKTTIIIKDKSGKSSQNNITLQAPSGSTIDGSSTFSINVNYASVTVVSDGTNYFIV